MLLESAALLAKRYPGPTARSDSDLAMRYEKAT
jgi:hypothetical protein